jgi:hypothetical protein
LIARIAGAAIRGISVALLIASPSLLLPSYVTQSGEIVMLLALLGGILTFAEYSSTFPSFIEFRYAPPLNRMRFSALTAMILILSAIAAHQYTPSNLTALAAAFGQLLGNATDFPYSPVRLVILMLPHDASLQTINAARMAAGVTYVIALWTVISFLFSVRVRNWPTGNGAFNVWVNLPLFDPTTGGDVVTRLQRDGRINVMLGALLPFLIPALVKAASGYVDLALLRDPQTLIWTVSGWAFLPASILMRGLAMLRIADLIEEKRRRTYANANAIQTI